MALTRPTAYQINTVSTTITDPLTVLNQGSTAANIDIGFILNRSPSANVAIVWQASSNQFIFANTSSSGTTNANITVSSYANLRTGNLITTSVTYANGQSILTNVESAITTANTNMKGYTDAANTIQSSQITTVSSSVTGANAAITTANTNMKGYVDGQISTTTSAITTANTNLKGYVDAGNTIQSGQITTVSSSVTGANAAIVTANTNLKGYVDSIDSTKANLSGAVFTGNINVTELFVTARSGDEGGQINLANAVTNTTLVGNVTIDVYQNKLRIWEGGGTNRGGYFDISGLSASVGTNLAGGGGGTPGGADSQIQFNNSSSFGGALSLHYFSGNGVVLANAAVASTSTTTGALQVSGGIGVAGNVWCGQVYSTNNGTGTNYRIGDDAWLGDVNLADTTRLMGVQNGNNGYLQFGNVGTETLGRAGSGALTWTGKFSAGNVVISASSASTSTSTGALQVSGGAGIAGNIYAGGIVDISSTTASTSTSTGALIVDGGAGIAGNVNAGNVSATNLTGTLLTASQPNITGVGTLGSLTVTGNVSAANLTASFGLYGTIRTAAQTTVTSVGTLTGLTTSGAITSTLATGTAPFTIASTTKVTNLNVDLLDGLHADTAYNSFGAGTIPVRHSSGYFYSNYFNMTADQTTTAATRIAVETGSDSFLRWQTPAQFITNSKIVDWKNHTAQLTMSGGGTVTFNGTALLWSARVIAIPAENAEYSASGYIDITCPTSGTVVYYNAANATTTVTATAAGIPLAAWEAIYYQVTEGQIYTSDQTKFRVVNYTNTTWSPGPGWLLIASRNGDDSTVRWLPGQKTIPSGGSYYTTSDTQSWAALTAKYADLAEKYVADKNYVPGTVVVFGGNKEITISSASHDPAIAGVISTNPAYLMNYEVDGLALSVALQGRVPCRVQGPINKGDCVVSSDTPGVAQRLDRVQYLPGCVIGKALEDITEDRIVTIEVVVGRV